MIAIRSADREPRLLTRREFLVWSTVAGTAAALFPYPLIHAPEVRLGVVGLGRRGGLLLEVLQGVPGVKVVGLCDRKGSVLRAVTRRNSASGSVTLATSDPRRLIQSPGIDGLLLALPPVDGCAVAELACRAGKNVLLARPAAISLSQAERLVEVSSAGGGQVALMPTVAWSRGWPLPWATAATIPGAARLMASFPQPWPPTGEGGDLGSLVDEVDFLRQLLDLRGAPMSVEASVQGATVRSHHELRARLRFDCDGRPDRRYLDLLVHHPRGGRRRSAQIELEWAAARLRLFGQVASMQEPLPVRREALWLRRETRTPLPAMPLDSAVASARLLSRLAMALGQPDVTTLM